VDQGRSSVYDHYEVAFFFVTDPAVVVCGLMLPRQISGDSASHSPQRHYTGIEQVPGLSAHRVAAVSGLLRLVAEFALQCVPKGSGDGVVLEANAGGRVLHCVFLVEVVVKDVVSFFQWQFGDVYQFGGSAERRNEGHRQAESKTKRHIQRLRKVQTA